ncbi:MAG: hypothetical protein BroJett025_10900 [Patescibacteria group bacterium]|nr:MAG: hypothetical protein BroJett025_10900 [Patescibacteria group bacterium]
MTNDFLKQLQNEAKQQQKLYSSRIIPQPFDPLTSFIGEHTFVVLSVLSVLSAIIVELVKRV